MKNIIFILLIGFLFTNQNIVVPSFDGDQAFEYIKKQCEFGPRYPGSLGH